MPSSYGYQPNELPAPYSPHGSNWMAWRLTQLGYTNAQAWPNADDGLYYLSVDEDNVSRNQLIADVQPADGALACNYTSLNVPPLTATTVAITGPAGKVVKVRFSGIGFVSETEFTIPGNNNYEFLFGGCPASQRVVTPQMFDFYVEDGSCSPVAVMVTFK